MSALENLPYLTKSQFLSVYQCHKLLWHAINDIEIARPGNTLDHLIRSSREAAALRHPLFEPTFEYESAISRADILSPVDGDAWDIFEVKSGTDVKEINLIDLAFQCHVYRGAGLKIQRCWLILVNNDYVRKGDVMPSHL